MWSSPHQVNVIYSPGMGGYFFHDLVSAIIGLIKFEVTPLPSNEYTYALKMHDIIERHHPHDIYDIDTFKGRVNLFINSNDIKMIYYARALKEMKIAYEQDTLDSLHVRFNIDLVPNKIRTDGDYYEGTLCNSYYETLLSDTSNIIMMNYESLFLKQDVDVINQLLITIREFIKQDTLSVVEIQQIIRRYSARNFELLAKTDFDFDEMGYSVDYFKE